jgi:pimeloyl-ACP methyl ester carboxylesterase
MIDYSAIDNSPELMSFVFYPRKGVEECPPFASDLLIKVDGDIAVSCRFYSQDLENPWILYFHGNGEIVSDYDTIALFYLQMKLNLVVAITGVRHKLRTPSLMNMLRDSHLIFSGVCDELARRGYAKKPWLMGRSLGSLSALELAVSHPGEIQGIIVESGFMSIVPILRHLFLPLPPDEGSLERIEKEAREQTGKISLPALVIHGDSDVLVPLQEARNLFEALKSPDKRILVIPNADHNTVIFAHPHLYFGMIAEFVGRTAEPEREDCSSLLR